MNSWERNKYDRTVNSGTAQFSPCGKAECWQGKAGAYGKFSEIRTGWTELFSIADTTQQVYLGLPGRHELDEGELNKSGIQKSPRNLELERKTSPLL